MNPQKLKWLYLIILSLVWGSSFILMKKALIGLHPIEMGALRILIAGLALFCFGLKSLKNIRSKDWKWIAVTGVLGTLLPVFLFAYAETEIDSSVVGILNGTTSLLTLILGIVFYGMVVIRNQVIGVILGLIGTVALILFGASFNPDQNYFYAILVLIASVGYALNANIIKRHLQHVPALAITTGNFVLIFIPALILLLTTDLFSRITENDPVILHSLGYISILAIIGTAIAKVLFNKLVQIADPIFASIVTYMIPIVALFWGVLDGEQFSLLQGLATGVILTGVFLVNKKKTRLEVKD